MPPLPPDVTALVREIAPAQGLDPAIVLAIIDVETGRDGLLISPYRADGSRDWGLCQINDGTLRQMSGKWRYLDPQRLVDDPALGIEAGCSCFRWYLVLAFRRLDLYPLPAQAWATLQALVDDQTRREVLAHAVAMYNDGEHGAHQVEPGRWANQGYVDEVLRMYAQFSAADSTNSE